MPIDTPPIADAREAHKMTTMLSAKDVATKLETSPKTLRKFLREHNRSQGVATPGKGHRWEIEAKQVRSLKTAFNAWNEAKATKPAEVPEEGNEVEVTEEA